MSPAYLANTFAVLTGGKYPIDQGKIHNLMEIEFWVMEKLGVVSDWGHNWRNG